ncbi:hypothetical protein chiPu_0022787 [Chiloscyllium punctatum]|uniref:Uncharacterized protein n=1 Tax=Chiloscyllium punctatum TaxID=137246 RepID=A0A401T9V8_CHIPU|nr:hypothetical protein [Chiloscyllium punctatum]
MAGSVLRLTNPTLSRVPQTLPPAQLPPVPGSAWITQSLDRRSGRVLRDSERKPRAGGRERAVGDNS